MAQHNIFDEKTENMINEQKEAQSRSAERRRHRILEILFVILLIFIVIRGIFSFIDLKSQEKETEEKYANLVEEKKELEETLEYINTPEYIEKAARDMLKMVMPGEILYIMRDNRSSIPQQQSISDDTGENGE